VQDIGSSPAPVHAVWQPGIGPCTTANVTYQGGPVVFNPRIFFIFWGSGWTPATESSILTTWTTMASRPAFYSRLNEYSGIGTGSFGGLYNYPSGATGSATSPVSLSESTIQSAIESVIGTNGPNDVIVVLMPNQYTTDSYDTSANYYGHHRNVKYTVGGTNYDLRYVVEEWYSPESTMDWHITHELAETFTDPDYATGSPAYEDPAFGAGGKEIGDICNGQTNLIKGVTVQQIWSQSACRCVRERDLNEEDGKGWAQADPAMFRPSSTTFFGFYTNSAQVFGASGDITFTGDFNGDGVADWGDFRPGSSLFAYLEVNGGTQSFTFGNSNDDWVRGDFDGDGVTDPGVWNASDGWRISGSTGRSITGSWGLSGDIPVPADYDGDGITDLAQFRPSNGTWYVLPSTNPNVYWYTTYSGATYGDIPVAKDFNGDGFADWAFYRPSTGEWYWAYATGVGGGSNSAWQVGWGQAGDIPTAADYDADWLTDIAVWRPSTGTTYYISSHSGQSVQMHWGLNGDVPLRRNQLQ
jgi:hypothetical protein